MSEKALWMLVADDEYELPLAVFDTQRELSEYCGVKQCTISSAVHLTEKGVDGRTRSRYVRAALSPEEWKECHEGEG